MDIKIDKVADRIIVCPVKRTRLGANAIEFDYSIPEHLFLEDLQDASAQLNKLVYAAKSAIPFWGYINEISHNKRKYSVYPGYWYPRESLKVLRQEVDILPNRFTVDRDIWVFENWSRARSTIF